jgi:hypothetical protein
VININLGEVCPLAYFLLPFFVCQIYSDINLGDIGGKFCRDAYNSMIMVFCALTICASQENNADEVCPLAYFPLAFVCLPNIF